MWCTTPPTTSAIPTPSPAIENVAVRIFRSIVFTSVAAGLIVGLFISLAYQLGRVPLILKGEFYERAAEAAAPAGGPLAMSTAQPAHEAGAVHEHHDEAWEPADGWQRSALTVLNEIL